MDIEFSELLPEDIKSIYNDFLNSQDINKMVDIKNLISINYKLDVRLQRMNKTYIAILTDKNNDLLSFEVIDSNNVMVIRKIMYIFAVFYNIITNVVKLEFREDKSYNTRISKNICENNYFDYTLIVNKEVAEIIDYNFGNVINNIGNKYFIELKRTYKDLLLNKPIS